MLRKLGLLKLSDLVEVTLLGSDGCVKSKDSQLNA